MTYFLTTPRLGFRLWSKDDDTSRAAALWCDPQVLRYIDARDALTPAEAEERLSSEIALQRDHGVQYWPIFLRETGQHVGCCGLHPKSDGEEAEAYFGVHLRAEFWGAGLAAEAGRAVVAYAFRSLGKKRLFAGHNPENNASRTMLRKLGFVYVEDEFYPPTGLMHPSYVMTAEEGLKGCGTGSS